MDIECKLKREGGSHVPLGTTTYHFAPREDGAHVATVTNEEHQDIFLGIREAYRMYRGASSGAPAKNKGAPVSAPSAAPSEVLMGADGYEASYEFHGQTHTFESIVERAFVAADCTSAAWNGMAEDERADLIDEQLDKLQAEPPAAPVVPPVAPPAEKPAAKKAAAAPAKKAGKK